ncbi:MAG: hypothetical protein D3923_04320, partial [Candidatus Electrothrix sp. AR3]|nr:hypothetical protein [Candidatus Electrothrix sp. AR3]
MRYQLLFLAAFSFFFCLSPVHGHELPDGAVPLEKSEKCAGCHPVIFKEWQESFHAKSSAHKDPAHKAVHQAFVKSMTDQGKQGNYHCGNCHAPMSDNLADLMSGKAELDSGNWTQTEGVGCTFCHRIDSVIEKEKFNQYKLNKDGAFHTAQATNPNAPHKTALSPLFANGQVCMGCHSHKINGKGAKICVMKEEGGGDCLSCHMPQAVGGPAIGSMTKNTHRSHKMPGGHDLDMLKKAVTFEAGIKSEGKRKIIDIKVKNIIQHTFPSTNPMRIAFVKVTAKDKTGKV